MPANNRKTPICDSVLVHQPVIDDVERRMPIEQSNRSLAEFFRVLGDGTRIKLLTALSYAELCVCDLAYILEASQSLVSHQLRILRQMNLVKYRKEGKTVYYSLCDRHIEQILQCGREHIGEFVSPATEATRADLGGRDGK